MTIAEANNCYPYYTKFFEKPMPTLLSNDPSMEALRNEFTKMMVELSRKFMESKITV